MSHEADKNSGNVIFDDRFFGLRKHSEQLNKLVVESLQGALLQLIVKKPYDKITVTELCKKAGVSRMAFYGNFDSKEEIFKRIVFDLHEEMLCRIGSPFRQKVTLNWYISLFNFIAEKSYVLKPIFGAGFQDKYLDYVNEIFLRNNVQNEETYPRLLWSGGIVNVIVRWLESDMRESSDEVAEICYNYFANLHNN